MNQNEARDLLGLKGGVLAATGKAEAAKAVYLGIIREPREASDAELAQFQTQKLVGWDVEGSVLERALTSYDPIVMPVRRGKCYAFAWKVTGHPHPGLQLDPQLDENEYALPYPYEAEGTLWPGGVISLCSLKNTQVRLKLRSHPMAEEAGLSGFGDGKLVVEVRTHAVTDAELLPAEKERTAQDATAACQRCVRTLLACRSGDVAPRTLDCSADYVDCRNEIREKYSADCGLR
jgi:hypothetical protein